MSTDHSAVVVEVAPSDQVVSVPGLTGDTTSLRIATARTQGTGFGYLGIADLRLPGLAVSRTLDTPVGHGTPVMALDIEDGSRPSCYPLGTDSLCSSEVSRAGPEQSQLDRTVHLQSGGTFSVSAAGAVPVAGAALDAVLDGGRGVTVAASSSASRDPSARPGTVLDGQLGTGWRAAAGDKDPFLRLTWTTRQTVTGLRVQVDQALAGSRARRVRLEAGSQERDGMLDATGRVSFAPLVATQITVHLEDVVPSTSLDPYSLVGSLLPVGVSELSVTGAAPAATPAALVEIPCSAGPVLRVGDVLVRTTARTDRATLQRLGRLNLRVCNAAPLAVGDGTRIIAPASSLLRPVSLTLLPAKGTSLGTAPAADLPMSLDRWGSTRRRVVLEERDEPTLLQVHENTNAGWQALLGGRRLTAVVVDGWQQGWIVPAGPAGAVTLIYAPDGRFRAALLVGAAALLVLLVLAVRRGGSELPATRPRTASWPVALLLLGVLVLIAGPAAAAVAVTGLLVLRGEHVRTAVAGLAALVAGGLLALHPWPGPSYAGRDALPQLLCVAALAAVWTALVPAGLPRRRAGRSTTR